MIWFGWVYGISTILHIYQIYDFLTHFVDNFFNEPKLIFFTQLKGFTYFYLIRINYSYQIEISETGGDYFEDD